MNKIEIYHIPRIRFDGLRLGQVLSIIQTEDPTFDPFYLEDEAFINLLRMYVPKEL